MADNFPTNAGSGGVTFASDDIAGVHFPRVKLTTGADGTAADVSAAAPMPTAAIGAATGTPANVAASATSVTVLAANAARKGALIVNDSSAALYLLFAASAASTTSYSVKLNPGETLVLEQGDYAGEIRGIWTVAAGNARVTEIS
jgi:hypothetical protein